MWSVQYLGRWGSDAVRLYTAQAYAEAYSQFSADAAAGAHAHRPRLDVELWAMVEQARAEPGCVGEAAGADVAKAVLDEGVVEAAAGEEAARVEKEVTVKPKGGGMCVTNKESGLTHATRPDWSDDLPFARWKSRCGWAFGGANGQLVRRPAPPFCSKCFPDKPPGTGSDGESEC